MQNDNQGPPWLPGAEFPELSARQVHIWRVLLELPSESVQAMESALSAAEAERAARFHFAAHRRRFVVSHASLRRILAGYLRCEPSQLDFAVGPYGKPALSSHPQIGFNLAHSGDYALIAVAQGRRLGIDVERIRIDNQLERIARRYFSSQEISEFMSLSTDQRTLGFFNCWTRKEAYIKAQGLGLSLPLDSFDVSLAPAQPAALRATRPDESVARRWVLRSLQVEPGYAGAVAIEIADIDELKEGLLEFSYWDWTSATP